MQQIDVTLPDGPLTITPGLGEPQSYTVKSGSISVADDRADELREQLGSVLTPAASVAAKQDS